MKITKNIFICVLLGALMTTTSVASAEEGGTWQQGGLSSNNVTSGTAAAQEAISLAATAWGLVMNTMAFYTAMTVEAAPLTILDANKAPVMVMSGGPVGWWLNLDFMGLALDGLLLNDAMTKKAKWSEDIPELTAAVRQIAEMEELEECEEAEEGEGEDAAGRDETCNALNAKLDGTEVHVSTLQNVGLEALEDVAGTILKTPEELLTAAPYIKMGLGTTTTEISATVNGEEQTTTRTLTTEESENMDKRKAGHLQLTGTAGVARSDLGTTVAMAEKNSFNRLSSYAGSGRSVVANMKVVAGLDLTLAQRLNLLNMIYGQQAANEAASALQLLQNK